MFDSCGLICLSISNHGRVTNLKLTPFLNVGLGPTYPARAFLFVLVAWQFQHVDLWGKSPAFLQEGCVSNLWGPPKNISICLPSLRMHASRHQDNPLIFLVSFFVGPAFLHKNTEALSSWRWSTWLVVRFFRRATSSVTSFRASLIP